MANPTTIVGYTAVLLDTTAAAQTLALRPDRNYAIRHLGIDNTNTTDSNLVKIAVNQTDGTGPADPVANLTAGTDVIPLEPGDVYVTEQVTTIKYINFGGAPMLTVVEVNRNFFHV